MKKVQNILATTLTVMVTLSIIMNTLLYAYRYTESKAVSTNSSLQGNGGITQGEFRVDSGTKPQGEFQRKDGSKPQGNPPNGDSKKAEN